MSAQPRIVPADPGEHCDSLLALLERQGYRELAAAELFSAGVRLAPSIDEKQMFARHALDELQHFDAVSGAYEELAGRDLLEVVAPRVARLPAPESWAEMIVVAWLFDRAGYYELRAYRHSPDARIRKLAEHLLADEREHLAASEFALRDLCGRHASNPKEVQSQIDRWLGHALESMDPIREPACDCSVGRHVDPLSSARACDTYLEAVQQTLRDCRLELPAGLH